MNTTQIGDKLEVAIHNLFQEELKSDRFWVRKEHAKIFLKKGYYSADRKKDIIFDISIEVTLPSQAEYSLLILIECKSAGRPVPVDDAEEFWAKINQVAGANTKGIIASTNSYAEGTINFSRSRGIGLLRYYEKSNFRWCLPRSTSSLVAKSFARVGWRTAAVGLRSEPYESQHLDFHCYSDDQYTLSLREFFLSLFGEIARFDKDVAESFPDILQAPRNDYCNVPYLGYSEIERQAETLLRHIGYTRGPVNLAALSQHYIKSLGVSICHDVEPEFGFLGRLNFNPCEIIIFRDDGHSPYRKRFTLAHELGHIAMGHSDHMISEYCGERDIDLEKQPNMGVEDIVRMEWQANAFASCLLLPKECLTVEFYRQILRMDIRNRGYGPLYLDHQPVNRRAYQHISDYLMYRFHVSRAAIKVRLKKLGFLIEAENDVSTPNGALKLAFAANPQP